MLGQVHLIMLTDKAFDFKIFYLFIEFVSLLLLVNFIYLFNLFTARECKVEWNLTVKCYQTKNIKRKENTDNIHPK